MAIEIVNSAIGTSSSHEKEGTINPGIVKMIVYKENDVESVVTLPDPDMNNFIPLDQVTDDKLIEWVHAHK
jgi:hypothetical protein